MDLLNKMRSMVGLGGKSREDQSLNREAQAVLKMGEYGQQNYYKKKLEIYGQKDLNELVSAVRKNKFLNLIGLGESKETQQEKTKPWDLPKPLEPQAWRDHYWESRKVVLMDHDDRERYYQKTLAELGQEYVNRLDLAVETWRGRGDAGERVFFIGDLPALEKQINQKVENVNLPKQTTAIKEEASEVLKMNR